MDENKYFKDEYLVPNKRVKNCRNCVQIIKIDNVKLIIHLTNAWASRNPIPPSIQWRDTDIKFCSYKTKHRIWPYTKYSLLSINFWNFKCSLWASIWISSNLSIPLNYFPTEIKIKLIPNWSCIHNCSFLTCCFVLSKF